MKPLVDDLDRAILRYLYEEGRMSSAEIARRVGHVSAKTVSNRIRRLTEKGIISVRAVVMPKPLGYDIQADISIEVKPGKARDVAQALLKLGRVNYVAIATGDRDLSIAVNAADTHDLQDFVHHELHTIPGVQKTKTYVITEILTRSGDWRIPEKLP